MALAVAFAVTPAAHAQEPASPDRIEAILGEVLPQPEQYFETDDAGGKGIHTVEQQALIPGVPVRQHPVNAGLFDTGCAQCHRLSGPLPPDTNAPPDVFDQLPTPMTDTQSPDHFTRLTTTNTRNEYPTWSPDGQHILFETRNDEGQYQLWLMNPDGTRQRQITEHTSAGWATWHPDSTRLAYWATTPDGSSNIWLYDLATSDTTRLTDHHATAWPAWSPDGDWLAYQARTTQGDWALHLLHPQSGNHHDLAHPRDTLPSRPIWNPDGTQILYQSLRNTAFELTRFIFPTGPDSLPDYQATPQRITTTKSYPIDLGAATQRPAWHPRDERVAFMMYTLEDLPDGRPAFSYKTWVTAPNGTNPRLLIPQGTFADRSPTWNAEGTWIAQWSWNHDFTASIWLVSEDATTRIELTKDLGGDALYPAWSPDGTRIAFASNRAGTFDIWIADVERILEHNGDTASR